jgi:hypothetical protein
MLPMADPTVTMDHGTGYDKSKKYSIRTSLGYNRNYNDYYSPTDYSKTILG